MAEVMAQDCPRLAAMNASQSASRLRGLIIAEAWTDAALALIEIELPHWTVRRIVREEGTWICTLSRQPNLPVELDDVVDVSHEVLPVALLGALLEVRSRALVARVGGASMPRVRPRSANLLCCENFA